MSTSDQSRIFSTVVIATMLIVMINMLARIDTDLKRIATALEQAHK